MIERYELGDATGIREAVKVGRLRKLLRPVEVNAALGIDYAAVFLPKHRDGNPGGTQLFLFKSIRSKHRDRLLCALVSGALKDCGRHRGRHRCGKKE